MTKLWFKKKLYGWGWTPASKEGWFVTIAFIAAVFYISRYAEANILKFYTYLIVLITLLIYIIRSKGEKPKWQWGKKKP